MRPVRCLVTDRARLPEPRLDAVVRQVEEAGAAGIPLIQIRERDLAARVLFELVQRAVRAVRGTGARILVNDRLDVALAAGAHGVHLRGDSFPAGRVRSTVPHGFLIGQSVHSAADAGAARTLGADYLIFGNVFDTASKPDRPGRGLSALAAVAAATPLPVLAIGGVTYDRVPDVLQAGAAGFAAISLFAGVPG